MKTEHDNKKVHLLLNGYKSLRKKGATPGIIQQICDLSNDKKDKFEGIYQKTHKGE